MAGPRRRRTRHAWMVWRSNERRLPEPLGYLPAAEHGGRVLPKRGAPNHRGGTHVAGPPVSPGRFTALRSLKPIQLPGAPSPIRPVLTVFTGPDFVIAGAPKCGTTSLCDALVTHPGVFMTSPKEPTYYVSSVTGRPARGMNFSKEGYAALFDDRRDGQVTGEGSTEYLNAHRIAAPALHADRPDARVVFIFRDPLEQTYSSYWFHILRGELPSGRPLSDYLDEPSHWLFEGARYAHFLRTWYDVFGQDQVLVLLTDDLRSDRAGTLARVCEHIGADPSHIFAEAPRSNVTRYPRWPRAMAAAGRVAPGLSRWASNRPLARPVRSRLLFSTSAPMPPRLPDDVARLVEMYATRVEDLAGLIGRDLSHWLSPG